MVVRRMKLFSNNTSLAGLQFVWDFGDGTSSTEVNPTHLYADTGAYVVHLLALDDGTCNLRDSTTQIVQVPSKTYFGF
ncbi:MAG: PKD domain-containing protein [Puia sp.]